MTKRIFLSPPWMGGDERKLVEAAFDSNYVAPCGPMVDQFEKDFTAFTHQPSACALSSCTAALDLLCRELDVQKGDTLFCSDLTFVASIAPAVHRGATPVFIDSDEHTWNMNPDLLAEALADAERDNHLPKAVIAVDLYGQCCDYNRIESICASYEVPLIIDSAEALGAMYQQRQAGDAGWASVYSFNGNKIITTSGGGMLTSRDSAIVDRARKRSQQSRENHIWYEHGELGYNYRMSNIVAAIGVGQLQVLPEIIRRKHQIFGWYRANLKDISGLAFMPEAAYGKATRWLTVITLNAEHATPDTASPSQEVFNVMQALANENIEARPIWKPMHLQPVFRSAKIYGGAVSKRYFNAGLCLPSGAGLTQSDVDRICSIVKQSLFNTSSI
ncbi:MAG: aminotransferase class I/II-fold pyridoxal phosphate-dependent enzyme [bacterium]